MKIHTKRCSTCEETKPLSEFCKKSHSKDGLSYCCRLCNSAAAERWRLSHPDRKRELDKRWNDNNADKVRLRSRRRRKENPEYHKRASLNWRANHEEHYAETQRIWRRKEYGERKSDPRYRLGRALRSRLSVAIRKKSRAGSAVRDLGCSVEFLRGYLEGQFHSGMTWGNYGKGTGHWNIDHIMPLSAFDLANRQHVLLACFYMNLQPMWQDENVRKSNKRFHRQFSMCAPGQTPDLCV